jgi:PAS domain S-box-containing protein
MQEVLRHNQQKSRAHIENCSDTVAFINAEQKVTYVSPSITSIMGYSPQEIVGYHVLALVHPDDLNVLRQLLEKLEQTPGKSLSTKSRLYCKDGSWRWFEGTGTNLLHVPTIGAIVANFHDIPERNLVPYLHWNETSESEHFVQFYESDEFFLDSLSELVSTDLAAGDASIVIATEAHREGLEERLKANGLDLAIAQTQDKYISLDAAETLSKFMVDGLPDPDRFTQVVGSIIMRAAKDGCRVRAFGEMVVLLWIEGNQNATLRLEECWNDLRETTHPFSLLCAYPMHSFDGEVHREQFIKICHQHSQAIPDESYTGLVSPSERLYAIALLQQKAHSLHVEIEEHRAVGSMVAHELKTPLTALQGNVQLAQRNLTQLLIRKEQLLPEQQRVLEKVLNMLNRSQQPLQMQHRLIDDLLDISHIQEAKLGLRLASCDLAGLVYQTVQDYQVAYPDRLITLELSEQDPLQVHADRDRLQQVLSNYLANALKFSPDTEPVHVGLSLEAGNVRVWVQDHGPGISREQQQHIWKRFYQISQTSIQRRSQVGLGLGLYICQQLISRQQGQVGIESTPGSGATFWFTLPIFSSLSSNYLSCLYSSTYR